VVARDLVINELDIVLSDPADRDPSAIDVDRLTPAAP
jgi:hypothetical protein